MRILHLLSCRGWSSDAYWAVRMVRELERRGHETTLGCRRDAEARVIDRARREGVTRIASFGFSSGVHPAGDVADIRRLVAHLGATDIVHVHRGKEHWLAAVANRLSAAPRPLIRTRHIAHAVRPHAGNRWLYNRATALVVTVTDAIRRQLLAAGLGPAHGVVTLAGGVDSDAYRALPGEAAVRRRLGGDGEALVGMIAGLRVMKGHDCVIEAAARLQRSDRRPRFTFIGRGAMEVAIRKAIDRAGIADRVTLAGFVDDVPTAMAALDLALYVPLESDGMSRVVFEYLAAGRPLIAARVGVIPEVLVDGEHALLVPAGDGAALADALDRALGDAPLRARLAAAGRRLVEERYSGRCVAAALESQYARLLSA